MNQLTKTPNLPVYLLHALAWTIVMAIEFLATIILQIGRPFFNYHLMAIGISLIVAIVIPILGRWPVIQDLQDLCWYDVAIQCYGLLCSVAGGSLAWYLMFSILIFFLKSIRLVWFEKTPEGAIVNWPIFGMVGFRHRHERPAALVTRQKYRLVGVCVFALILAELQRRYWNGTAGLYYCFIIGLALRYTKPLITHLETQQEQLRTTMEELGAARVRAELAEVMAAQAAELAVKNEEMNRLNLALEKLNQELGLRNDDLITANCAIDAQNVELARQSRVVAQANHDIMPLMMMIHELTQLAMEVDTTERQHEILRQVIDCNATMGERMERLIGVQRIKMHKARSIFSAVHLSEVIDMLDLPFCRMAEKRGGSFAVKGTYHRKVWSNAEYLDRIISNLIKNAIIHNPPGTHVRLLVTMRRNACIIRIFDNGKGIPETGGIGRYQNFTDLVQRVAARADLPAAESTSVAPEAATESSHGIGLQSVAALCKELGLGLRLYSRFRLGAIFEIWLELAA